MDCLVGITQCTRERTRDAIVGFLSLLYSYKYIIDRPLIPDVNYPNVRLAFQCNQSKLHWLSWACVLVGCFLDRSVTFLIFIGSCFFVCFLFCFGVVGVGDLSIGRMNLAISAQPVFCTTICPVWSKAAAIKSC